MNRTLRIGVKKLQRAFSLKANRADTGIGTLIIFIAMVLVAAVAATVLIHTAGSLQQRAQSTGTQTSQQVSSGINVQSVWGLDNNSSPEAGTVSWVSIYVSLGTGSSPINLANVTLSLTYGGRTAQLTYVGDSVHYNGTTTSTNNPAFSGYHSATSGTSNVFESSYFSALNANGTTGFSKTAQTNATANASKHFAILAISDSSNSMTGKYPVLTGGDEAAILVNVSAVFGGLNQDQSVTGSVTPQVGSAGVIQFTTPVAYTQQVMELQ
jgi:flagellin FlaB